jgi:Polysaccharide lyase
VLRHLITLAISGLAMAPLCQGVAARPIVDGFDVPAIDLALWAFPENAAGISAGKPPKVSGAGALAVTVSERNFDQDCECERLEIREAPPVALDFGTEAWYRFSFRIDGDRWRSGDQRWIIAAWKQQVDGSPFLAFRYDRNVFHITVQSAGVRHVLASSLVDSRMLMKVLDGGHTSRFGFISDSEQYEGASDLQLNFNRNSTILPDPYENWVDMAVRVKGGLNGDGVVEVYANGQFIASAAGTIGIPGATANKQYLRLGHNRDRIAGAATLSVDNYRRGATRQDVESPNGN